MVFSFRPQGIVGVKRSLQKNIQYIKRESGYIEKLVSVIPKEQAMVSVK